MSSALAHALPQLVLRGPLRGREGKREGSEEGKGKGAEGQGGTARGGEVDSGAQLEQGRQLAKANPVVVVV